jgi:hypothetical protein
MVSSDRRCHFRRKRTRSSFSLPAPATRTFYDTGETVEHRSAADAMVKD